MQFIYDIKILDFNIAYENYSNLISNNPKKAMMNIGLLMS